MDQIEHELQRKELCRLGWINWRMLDLPVIYQNLLPYSYNAKTLSQAEKAIRAQSEADLKLLQSPWRTIGPECNLLDFSSMTPTEQFTFGLEVKPMAGMVGKTPKHGRYDETCEEVKEASKRWLAEEDERKLNESHKMKMADDSED